MGIEMRWKKQNLHKNAKTKTDYGFFFTCMRVKMCVFDDIKLHEQFIGFVCMCVILWIVGIMSHKMCVRFAFYFWFRSLSHSFTRCLPHEKFMSKK
jgi:hypothetical protein